MKESYKTGRKMSYLEQIFEYVILPFCAKIIAFTVVIACIAIPLFLVIKLIKYLWYL
jgi:hypothetical protein